MKKVYGGKLIQPLMAAAVFLLISVVYFLPQLQGKVIQQSDTISWKAMYQEAKVYKEKNGRDVLWTNSMFGGMPAFQMGVPQKSNVLTAVYSAHQAFISRPIGYFFAAMLACYIVLISLGTGHWPAMLGAVSFGLTTNQLILFEAGHNTKFMTVLFSAYLFGGTVLAYRKQYIAGGLIFTVGMGLSLLANHLQMTYYMGLFLLLYVIAVLIIAIKQGEFSGFIKASAILLAGLFLALGASASKLWTTRELAEETMRGKPILEKPIHPEQSSSSNVKGLDWDYAMQWSNGPKDLLASLIPRAAGGSGAEELSPNSKVLKELRARGVTQNVPVPLYHGDLPFTSGPIYFGACVLFLFVFGLFYVKPAIRWWLLAVLVLSLLLSMGKHFSILNKPVFDLLPLYNKFRTPNSILSITALFVALGAALGLGGFMKGHEKSFQRPVWIALGIVGGLSLLTALLGPALMNFSSPGDARMAQVGFNIDALIADRKSALTADAWRSFIWVVLCAGVVWVYHQGKIKQWLLLSGLGLLIIADLWGVGRRYINTSTFVDKKVAEAPFNPRTVDTQILQDPDLYYRVHDLTVNVFNSSIPAYHHRIIGGYSPAKLQRYQDLIDRYLAAGNMNVLNMLNAKYFITNGDNPRVQLNPDALGNAWFVDEIGWVKTNNEELESIDTAVLYQTAFVHVEFEDQLRGFTPQKNGTISLTSYEPDRLAYRTSSTSEQLAVFSDIYYGPDLGWQAYIDGQKVPHFRVNYILRGLRVPAGDHEVRFIFEPKSYSVGEKISLVCSTLILLALLYGLYLWLTRETPVIAAAVPETIARTKSTAGKRKNQ